MTDVDTAAIRAARRNMEGDEANFVLGALCDALDAARAERDNAFEACGELQAELNAAEARIAVALATHRTFPDPTLDCTCSTCRALTGGDE